MRFRRLTAVVIVVVALGVTAFVFRHALGRWVLGEALGIATGSHGSVADFHFGGSASELRGIRLVRGDRTLLSVDRVLVRYRLRDLLPGGARRYGLVAVEVDRPSVTVHREADGSLDVWRPAGGKPATQPAAAAPQTPLRVTIRIRDGRVAFIDEFRRDPASRRFVVDGLTVDSSIDTAARTRYHVRGAYEPEGVRYPFSAAGVIDANRAYALNEMRAAAIPLREIANYFINDGRIASLQTGSVRNVDFKLYSLGSSGGYRLGGTADLSNLRLAVTALRYPLSDLSGRVQAFDDGFVAPKLAARIGGVRLQLGGGLFNFADPRIRLAALADTPLPQLRELFEFSHKQPLTGNIALRILVEGLVSEPLILAHLQSSDAGYGTLPIDRIDGTVAFYRNVVTMAPFDARYGGVNVEAHGNFAIGARHVATEAAYRALAPASAVPYTAQSVPSATLHATGLLGGIDSAFATRGVLTGSGGGDSIDGLYQLDARGDGEFGPMLLARGDGSSVAAAFVLDRSESRSAFWLDARNFRLTALAHPPVFPGLPQIAPPPFAGVFDGSIGGVGPPSHFALAGNVRAHDMTVSGGVKIAAAQGQILGSASDVRLGDVRAQGTWGRFAGSGAFDGVRLGLRGKYAGTFAGLAQFTGPIGAAGAIAAPVAMLVDSSGTVVQTAHAASPGATIRGVPLDDMTGTLQASPRGVRIFAAQARIASAPLAAAGSLVPGGGLGLAIADADASKMAGIDVPLDSGRLSAIGTASLDRGNLRFGGGALVGGGTYKALAVSGNGDVLVDANAARFERIDARFATVYASAAGSVAGLGRAAKYDVAVRVRAADLGDAAAAFGSDRYHLDGSADADLRIGGSGADPRISGHIVLPEATVNGLFIDRAGAEVAASPVDLIVRSGTATVGSTVGQFSGEFRAHHSLMLHVDSARADLSDFDGFFDPGDLLSGTGRIALGFSRRGERANTTGDFALQRTRIAHFDFGAIDARWTSAGSRIAGRGAFAGRLGRLDAAGNVDLPARLESPRDLRRSRFDVRLNAAGLDIGAWSSALGYDVPIGGRIDANGAFRGRFPALALAGTASLRGGSIGKLPIDQFTINASSSLSRTTIENAVLDLGSVAVRGSGSFGYSLNQPFSLALHGSSPDIGVAVTKLTGAAVPLHGALEADVKASGALARPTVTGGFDIEHGSLAGVAVPRALGEFGMSGKDVQLRDVEVAFSTGTLYLAGTMPLTLSPLGLGPPQAQITLEAAPKGIDLADFVPLMPQGSRIRGMLDGRVAVRGTVATPQLEGRLSLTGGELAATGFEVQPLRNISGSLTFSGTSVRLDRLRADAGTGSIELNGAASVPNLVHIGGDASYEMTATLRHPFLDLPAYGKGQLDGQIGLSHTPGELPVVGGNVTVADAVIPFSALYSPRAGGSDEGFGLPAVAAVPFGLPNVAFDLSLTAGRNVRVRSSVIDIGGAGTIHAAGTLASPQLTGALESTGGTLTYFNTVFRVVEGLVTFAPGAGIVPVLDARATTHVINPDPNLERNLTGSADITLTVKGPVTNLVIGLDSDPAYDRQQILGLLLSAPAVGARSLFAEPATPGAPPPLVFPGTQTGAITVGQTAFGVLNAQFTRNLLAPIESSLGGALGLSSVNFTFDYTGNVGVSARKLLGKNIYAVYGTTLGYPYRQTWGFELRPTPSTAAQFTFFQTIGVLYGNNTAPVTGAVSRETLSLPIAGQSGFSFSLQRFLW